MFLEEKLQRVRTLALVIYTPNEQYLYSENFNVTQVALKTNVCIIECPLGV